MRWFVVAVISVAALLAMSTPAVANTPPDQVSPLDCLDQWENNPNYVGDGWPQAHVATVNGLTLHCGDESTGIVHIAADEEETTGHGHPIAAGTQSYFLQCFGIVARSGERRPDPEFEDRERVVYSYFDIMAPLLPGEATAIIDKATGRVRTLFTSTGAEGNEWVKCAGESASRIGWSGAGSRS